MGLDVTGIGAISQAASQIISIFKASKTVQQQIQGQLDLTELQGQIQEYLSQIEVNKQEAASTSLFVAGWRPLVGWVCGGALAYQYIIQPFAQFALVALHVSFNASQLPQLSTGELMPLLLGLLGLTAARTYEKVQGANAAGSVGH